MAGINLNGASLGTSLKNLLMCDEIEPGSAPSYQICKEIYEYHPLGAKIVETPIAMAQSQQREITIQKGPEERVREAFLKEWAALGADKHIFNTMRLSRVYGIGSLAILAEGVKPGDPLDYTKLWQQKIAFNDLDPLNTAGSLVLNQDPNSLDFLKTSGIAINGIPYHRSRSCVVMNGDPIYIGYTTSAFGYVGRSVYQRSLFPLKSFVNTLITDDLVVRKAGLLVAMMKAAGSIIDNVMAKMAGIKRQLLKEAQTGNVISIDKDEKIETLNMQNLDGAYGIARKNILENIAAAADDMPAKLLNQETFAEGFGEGTEDAKHVARYIDRKREQMKPLYDFFDRIAQYRAWNPEFYKTIQADFPEYRKVPYKQAFYEWVNSFTAAWPSLLTEPDSEKIKVDDVKLKAIIALVQVFAPMVDPDNKARLLQWVQDNFNELKLMFGSPLQLDFEAMRDYVPPQQVAEPEAPAPFSREDAQAGRAIARYDGAVEDLLAVLAKRARPRLPVHTGRAAA